MVEHTSTDTQDAQGFELSDLHIPAQVSRAGTYVDLIFPNGRVHAKVDMVLTATPSQASGLRDRGLTLVVRGDQGDVVGLFPAPSLYAVEDVVKRYPTERLSCYYFELIRSKEVQQLIDRLSIEDYQ